jgi:hypothetical protein
MDTSPQDLKARGAPRRQLAAEDEIRDTGYQCAGRCSADALLLSIA